MSGDRVTLREFYAEMKEFRGEVASLRVQMAGMPCATHTRDIAALKRSRVNWRIAASVFGAMATALGLDKAWQAAGQALAMMAHQ